MNQTPKFTKRLTAGRVFKVETLDRLKRSRGAAGQYASKIFELCPEAAQIGLFRVSKVLCWTATSIAVCLEPTKEVA